MTIKEIEARKMELKTKIDEANSTEELEELRSQIDEINKEVPEEETSEITHEEERNLINDTEELEKRSKEVKNLKVIKEEEEMEERKFTIADKEYRSAWAKKLMGLSEDKFTEEEKRALGDAVTTTATEYVASTADTQGINNGGLFIPTSVREEFMERVSEVSPFFKDLRKLQVAGNIDLPYLEVADDAKWYTELKETDNEGQKYNSIQLTGWELAKDVVITWKLEEMAVDSFIDFILDELYEKMGVALIEATLYGDGNNKPKGVTKGLKAIVTGETPIDTIIDAYKSLGRKARIGAKAYISTNVNIEICAYKDKNGNYPFLQGLSTNKLVDVVVDPFLHDNDIVVGNARNYILNEVTPLRVERERTVKGRKITFGGYSIVDGAAKPNAFAYGQYTPAV